MMTDATETDATRKTDPKRPSVRLSRDFPYPRERVFRAWTDPSLVIRWFGGRDDAPTEVDLDCTVGGVYRIHFSTSSRIEGAYQEVMPPERLVFTWTHVSVLDDGAERRTPESLVTVNFEDRGGATHLTVLHERLSGEAGRAGVSAGWIECFDKIDALLRDL